MTLNVGFFNRQIFVFPRANFWLTKSSTLNHLHGVSKHYKSLTYWKQFSGNNQSHKISLSNTSQPLIHLLLRRIIYMALLLFAFNKLLNSSTNWLDKRLLKMRHFKCVDIFISSLLLPYPSLSFLHFFQKETCLAAITALTVCNEYCFTKVACLLALYIKRARSNIILLWIFMGTKRLLPLLFVSHLDRGCWNILRISQYYIYIHLFIHWI